MSPTQRTLAYLRKEGRRAQVVERWNQYARVRQDLFGCIDIVALGRRQILGIQATDGTSVAKRLTKMLTEKSAEVRDWLAAGGRLECWGWRKTGPRGKRKTWSVRRVHVVLSDDRLVALDLYDREFVAEEAG